jgi:RNA polymerase sigma factor (sigma-70 family)
MTETQSPDPALFWSESLAEELLRFLTGRVNCPETAADLTHETYLRLYQVANKNLPDNARAMAFRIAVNLAVDYQRRCTVRNRHTANVDSDLLIDTIADTSAAEPLQILISKERFNRLESALNELSPDCRRVFLLNKVEGLGYREIGQCMDITIRQVGRLLEQAINHCLQRLAD